MGDPSRVVPRRRATQDLRDAAAHYAAEADAATARRFIDAAEQAFTVIARQPGIGSPRYAVELAWPGLRTHPIARFPCLIFSPELAPAHLPWGRPRREGDDDCAVAVPRPVRP